MFVTMRVNAGCSSGRFENAPKPRRNASQHPSAAARRLVCLTAYRSAMPDRTGTEPQSEHGGPSI